MKRLVSVLVLWLTAGLAWSQVPQVANWIQVANEGDSIVSPVPASFQACADATHCTAVVPVTKYPLVVQWLSSKTIPVWGTDPLTGTAKHIGIIATATPQMITVNGGSVSVPSIAVTVPPPVAVWRYVCPIHCTVSFSTAGTVGSVPTLKIGKEGTPFTTSPLMVVDAAGPVMVSQDGLHGYTFTWSDDDFLTTNKTVVGTSDAPVVTPVNACIKFALLPPYAAILCGPIANQIPPAAPLPTSTTN